MAFAPVLIDDSIVITGQKLFSGAVPAGFDIDGSIVRYTLLETVNHGSLAFNSDGSYTFDPGVDFDDLSALRNDMSLTFFATDNDGRNSRAGTVTITIEGTNDAPTISIKPGDTDSASLTEIEVALSTSGTLTVTDVDLSDNVSLTTSVAASGTTTGIEFDNSQLAALFTVNSGSINADPADTKNISWTFNAGTDAFDYLADGESLTLTYTIPVTDDASATASQDVTITIDGTNDAPTISVKPGDTDSSITHRDRSCPLHLGTLTVNDADLSDNVS